MHIRFTLWAIVLLGLNSYAGAAALPPAEAFGALPQTFDVVISPDGNLLAWVQIDGDVESIQILDVQARKILRSQRLDASMKARSLIWSDNSTLLLHSSYFAEASGNLRKEFFRLIAIDVKSGANTVMLMAGGQRMLVSGASLLSVHTDKPGTIVMSTIDYDIGAYRNGLGTRLTSTRRDSGWRPSVYEVDTRSGHGTLLEEGSPFTARWVVDSSGRVVARSEWNPDGHVYRVLAKNGLGWREIYHQEGRDSLGMAGLSPDGTMVLALDATNQGNTKLLGLPLDGSAPRVVVEEPGRDIGAVLRDPYSLQPIGVLVEGAERSYRWLTPADQQRYETISKAFPDKQVWLRGNSENHQRVVVKVTTPSLPGTFYLVDFQAHKADIVGEEYPLLAKIPLGVVSIISYKARDGTDIPAYLTLPPSTEAKNLPLVVLPHGGPEGRDDHAFNWWAQFLATRGYAVLQPQFRGSTGFGTAFRLAGRHQWGGLMQDDLSDGVRFLTTQGIADAGRVCIVGANYGGYAALAGAAFTPQLYACAVSVNGISNLAEMREWLEKRSGGEESNTMGYWRDSIGGRVDPQLQARSPIHAAAEFRAPVLIIYSADDTEVPPGQSEEMARALHDTGKQVKLVKLKGDDHWLSHADTRTQMLREIEQFLAAQLH